MAHEIEAPFLWFAQLVDGTPKPWKYFHLDGIMVNAYEIMKTVRANKNVREKGIHDFLGFAGPVMMDSGGFQFMKEKEISVDPIQVIQLFEDSKPDFGVALDHPLGPNLSSEEKIDRCMKTLRNTRIMIMNNNNSTKIVPAIHGHGIKEVEWFLRELDKISTFDYMGIGSLVPSVFSTKGAGGITNVIEIVDFVRKRLDTQKIHVFGIGSTITMHLMFYAGADSVDSSSWRTKAAYGAIQLSGVGDRYITNRKRRKNYRDLSKTEEELLTRCECPICREEGLVKLRRSFSARALHNAWVFQKEVERARELIDKGDYESYVQATLKHSSLSYAFDFARQLKS